MGVSLRLAEWYRVPADTAHQVNATHASGRRVVAIGTTVVRALESAADPRGRVAPATGWSSSSAPAGHRGWSTG